MTDLEITKLCAKAIGIHWHDDEHAYYWPLHDDAQAMALVKKLSLCISREYAEDGGAWLVWPQYAPPASGYIESADLNRAICECVAKMQAKK